MCGSGTGRATISRFTSMAGNGWRGKWTGQALATGSHAVALATVTLVAAVLSCDFAINGFRNRDLQGKLYLATDAAKVTRRTHCTSRLTPALRGHGLIGKAKNSRLYGINLRGYKAMGSAVRFRKSRLSQSLPRSCQVLRRNCIKWWRGLDSNQRRLSQRIYSPSPLATRAPLQNEKDKQFQRPEIFEIVRIPLFFRLWFAARFAVCQRIFGDPCSCFVCW